MNPSPGPWRWLNGHWDLSALLSAKGEELVRASSTGDIHVYNDDDKALIAAAPEMREMLLKLEWQHDDDYTFCCVCQAGRRDDSRSKKPLTHETGCTLGALLERIR